VEQLVEIVKVLGTPSKAQIERMCRDYTGFKFPQIVRSPWRRIFRSPSISDSAIDLIDHMLVYDPELRMSPLELLSLPFFDELRDPSCTLPSGEPLPELFDFSDVELQGDEDKPFVFKLIPPHKRTTTQ
jgi:kinase